jgi:hypothetical protein
MGVYDEINCEVELPDRDVRQERSEVRDACSATKLGPDFVTLPLHFGPASIGSQAVSGCVERSINKRSLSESSTRVVAVHRSNRFPQLVHEVCCQSDISSLL